MTQNERTLLNSKVKQIKKQFKEEGWKARIDIREYRDETSGLLYISLFDDDMFEFVVDAPYRIDLDSVKTSTLQVHIVGGFITSYAITRIEKVLGK